MGQDHYGKVNGQINVTLGHCTLYTLNGCQVRRTTITDYVLIYEKNTVSVLQHTTTGEIFSFK